MNDNMKLYYNQPLERKLPVQRSNDKRYMPGIDGLRALSVIAVIAYHLNLSWAQGGLLGVGIFFVISGYLITDQLINEWEKHRRLNLIEFIIRRARRLLPAMVGMMLIVAIWLICTDPSRLFSLKGDYLSSLFYVNNWYLIFHNVSYFESFGPPSPIGHLWSLSIEEQFYIIWPLILAVGLKLAQRRGKLMLMILTCAAFSYVAMAVIYVPGIDPSRVYYGTDTRAFALLIGAALAVIWPSRKLNRTVSMGSRCTLDIVGAIGVITLLVCIHRINEYDDWLYPAGFLVISIISAVVIAVLSHPASILAKIMGCKPLRWIGVRSYSLYIWHYPVIILSSPNGKSNVYQIIVQLLASLILAALSYKYIEEPFRHRGLKRKQHSYLQRYRYMRPAALTAIIVIILVPVSCSKLTSKTKIVPPPHLEQKVEFIDGSNQQQDKNSSLEEEISTEQIEQPIEQKEDENSTVTDSANQANWDSKDFIIPEGQSGKGITAIGDSVLLDAAPFLEKLLPGIVIDGKVGRQMWHAADAITQLKEQGKLGSIIIIELGNNGSFNTKQLRTLLQTLGDDKHIYFVNTRVPKKWQDKVNKDLSEVSNDFSNTSVVDWYSASKEMADYFAPDGVHLTREGAEYYASILAKAVKGTEK